MYDTIIVIVTYLSFLQLGSTLRVAMQNTADVTEEKCGHSYYKCNIGPVSTEIWSLWEVDRRNLHPKFLKCFNGHTLFSYN